MSLTGDSGSLFILELHTTADFSDDNPQIREGTGTGEAQIIRIEGLTNGTAYYLRAGYKPAEEDSASTAWVSWPHALTPNIIDLTINNVVPKDRQLSISVTSSQKDSTLVVELADDDAFSSPIATEEAIATGEAQDIVISGLENNTPYYLRVGVKLLGETEGDWKTHDAAVSPAPTPAMNDAVPGNKKIVARLTADLNSPFIVEAHTTADFSDNPPQTVEDTGTGEAQIIRIDGLTNGTAYYLRAAYKPAEGGTETITAWAPWLKNLSPKTSGITINKISPGDGQLITSVSSQEGTVLVVELTSDEDFQTSITTEEAIATGETQDIVISGLENNTLHYLRVGVKILEEFIDEWQNYGVAVSPVSSLIEIDSLEKMAKIGVDPFYPSNGNYILTQNLDFDSEGFDNIDDTTNRNWKSIGDSSTPFVGVFDGNGYIVSGLKGYGLFSVVGSEEDSEGMIKNLGVDISIDTLNLYSGDYGFGLIDRNYGTVLNCFVSGEMETNTHLSNQGPFVNKNLGIIANSYSAVNITQIAPDSGFPAQNVSSFVASNQGIIRNSYSTGQVSTQGGSRAAGFVSDNSGTIQNSYSVGNITSERLQVGGLAGSSGGFILNSFAAGNVEVTGGSTDVGGLIGKSHTQENITNSYRYEGQIVTIDGGTNDVNTIGNTVSSADLKNTDWYTNTLNWGAIPDWDDGLQWKFDGVNYPKLKKFNEDELLPGQVDVPIP